MSQNFIDIFKASCVKLAHSVVINHPYAGMVINKRLEQEGFARYTNDLDRNTWKYYLNMAGIYHAYDSAMIHKINKAKGIGQSGLVDSSKMIIRVAGDEGTIEKEFTLQNISSANSDENLSLDYQPGTRAYNELLDTYPEFEGLIKGILHPIPLLTSTNAEDFAVLYCGGYYRTRLNTLKSEYAFIKGTALVYGLINLVEEWEYSLISKIEEFTKIYFKQHDNRVYAQFNDLQLSASIGIYYLNLPTLIFNLRLERVKDLEVHSTHVQLYLDSYNNIGQYMSYLTRAQYMYLYRNVEWLAANAGKQKVFDDLVANFLKPRGLAVIVYDGFHDTDKLGIEEEPRPIFIRDYDDGTKLINTKKRYTPTEIIALEKPVARDNDKYVEDQIEDVTSAVLNSKSGRFKTKIVETHFSTQTLNQYVSKEEFLFNNWVWSALNGEYTGIVSISLPGNGNKLQLTIKNALILFYYCYGKGYLNITPTKIPELLLHHIPKTFAEIGNKDVLKKRISDQNFTQADLDKLYSLSPARRRYTSSGQFGREMDKLWIQFNARNYVAHANPFMRASGQIKAMVDQLYHVKKVKIELGRDYESWIGALGGNISTMDQTSLRSIADTLLSSTLNIEDESEGTLKKIHKALINIVKTFAGYNIQFVTTTASGEVSNLGTNYLRAEHSSTRYFDDNDYHIFNYADYDSIVQNSFDHSTRLAFDRVYTSHSNAILLSQEQLKGLLLSENNDQITLGDL